MNDYDKFRTGLTFKAVYEILQNEKKEKEEKGQYMFITRRTVLGRWHEIKKCMWFEFQELCKRSLGEPIDTSGWGDFDL